MSIIGVIHLPPLPGAPGHATSMSTIVDAARQDAITLSEAGFDAIIIENFGDAPFFADNVPPA
ncbi:MAG: photosystem I assembly BtpA, partial [Acidimicrobiia bacterium]|nr:photosystem I assembly BtpA [Acidimicrobiia bacterium]